MYPTSLLAKGYDSDRPDKRELNPPENTLCDELHRLIEEQMGRILFELPDNFYERMLVESSATDIRERKKAARKKYVVSSIESEMEVSY